MADFGESKQFDTKLADENDASDLTLTLRGTFLYSKFPHSTTLNIIALRL